ncbi:hypothetical protein [Bradyrhizobium canariense]|uniref:hypothetical protein n=1 Tax=Bradyrhizobium canariense TaxID=255045 RepID=UPI0011BA6881|nr:hypothetical protein [Bradyrhizobium canariense]
MADDALKLNSRYTVKAGKDSGRLIVRITISRSYNANTALFGDGSGLTRCRPWVNDGAQS